MRHRIVERRKLKKGTTSYTSYTTGEYIGAGLIKGLFWFMFMMPFYVLKLMFWDIPKWIYEKIKNTETEQTEQKK